MGVIVSDNMNTITLIGSMLGYLLLFGHIVTWWFSDDTLDRLDRLVQRDYSDRADFKLLLKHLNLKIEVGTKRIVKADE